MTKKVMRGDIFVADLDNNMEEDVQRGIRPVVIIQNDIGNYYSPTTIVAPCTTKDKKLQVHTRLNIKFFNGDEEENTILCEQIRIINKSQLHNKIGRLTKEQLDKVTEKVKESVCQ